MLLHGYWRSGTSYRTRIALNLKGLAYDQAPVDLRKGEQRSHAFTVLNPQGLVPAIEIDGQVLWQSIAIIEWLDEAYPDPPLLPRDAADRAHVRAMALAVACDIHPLNNLRVLQALKRDLCADDAAIARWQARWITDGFAALEQEIARVGGRYSFGDDATIADCCLIPQIYSAERFGVDLTPFPRIVAIGRTASAHPAFAAAHPDRQPDAD